MVAHGIETIKKTKVAELIVARVEKYSKRLASLYPWSQYEQPMYLSVDINYIFYEVNGTSQIPPAFQYWTTSK